MIIMRDKKNFYFVSMFIDFIGWTKVKYSWKKKKRKEYVGNSWNWIYFKIMLYKLVIKIRIQFGNSGIEI